MIFAERVRLLEGHLARFPSLLVAVSGGVDSAALLAAASKAVRSGGVVAATTFSPAVPWEEVEAAAATARALGVPHMIVETAEIDDPLYVANRGDRCYHCRKAMYGGLGGLGFPHIADGLLADDDVADRPGVAAAAEQGVLHPLRDCGFSKADSRRLARAHGLSVHDKPAQPCLASRIPVGLAVTRERLALVHRAESALRRLGLCELRVRCDDRHARVEVGRAEFDRACAMASRIVAAVIGAGFRSCDPPRPLR